MAGLVRHEHGGGHDVVRSVMTEAAGLRVLAAAAALALLWLAVAWAVALP